MLLRTLIFLFDESYKQFILMKVGREEGILHEWLDCVVTKGGCLVALQKTGKRPLMIKQMVDEWLEHYRQLPQVTMATNKQTTLAAQTFSSDGESDQE